MKKKLQFICLACILLFSSLLFSGCDALDELREKQAFITENRDIIYDGATFVLMPESDLLYPVYNYSSDCMLNVTAEDVPVLLSPIISEKTLYMSEDGIFLCGYSETGEIIYCREDKYDEMLSRIKEDFKPTKACYFYETFDSETYEYTPGYYVLADDEYDAVKDVMKSTSASVLPSDAYMDYDHVVYLELCSDDILLRKYVMDIALSDNQYYIIYYSDDETTQIFTVPDTYNAIFTKLMEEGITADRSFDAEYEEYVEEVSF